MTRKTGFSKKMRPWSGAFQGVYDTKIGLGRKFWDPVAMFDGWLSQHQIIDMGFVGQLFSIFSNLEK